MMPTLTMLAVLRRDLQRIALMLRFPATATPNPRCLMIMMIPSPKSYPGLKPPAEKVGKGRKHLPLNLTPHRQEGYKSLQREKTKTRSKWSKGLSFWTVWENFEIWNSSSHWLDLISESWARCRWAFLSCNGSFPFWQCWLGACIARKRPLLARLPRGASCGLVIHATKLGVPSWLNTQRGVRNTCGEGCQRMRKMWKSGNTKERPLEEAKGFLSRLLKRSGRELRSQSPRSVKACRPSEQT